MKRNIIYIGLVLLIALIAIYLYAQSKKIIHDVVIYEPHTTVGSFHDNDTSFKAIDRTSPMNVLFSKTLLDDESQLYAIYPHDELENKAMLNIIWEFESSDTYKKNIQTSEPLFSFYYEGIYGPPHWFCFFEEQLNETTRVRVPYTFEFKNGEWRESARNRKYPVRIALDDLDTDYYIFDAKNPLTPEIIRDFIDRCQEIDEIITQRMQTDPDYYNPVQDGPY